MATAGSQLSHAPSARPNLRQAVIEMDGVWAGDEPHKRFAEHFAEDGVLYDMTAPEPAVGRTAIADAMSVFTTAFSDLAFRSTVVADDGSTATVEWTATGVHTGILDTIEPTGNRIEIRGVNLLRCNAAGEIVEERSYWDAATLLSQLGAFDA